MRLFSRHLKASRPPEIITLPHLEFIGEQAGPVEDDLKAQLREVLQKTPAVQRAYLARLSCGDPAAYSVGLCIRSTAGVDHPLRKRLGHIFTDMFSREQHLDILFIREDQEEQLKKVCIPFYQQV